MGTHFSLPSPSLKLVTSHHLGVTHALKREWRGRQGLQIPADLPWPWDSLLALEAGNGSSGQVTSRDKQLPQPPPFQLQIQNWQVLLAFWFCFHYGTQFDLELGV